MIRSRTTPYPPLCNGEGKIFNQSLLYHYLGGNHSWQWIFGPANVANTAYADKWKIATKEAYSLAVRKNTSKTATDGKRQSCRKVRFSKLQPGDRVLVRNISERGGSGKLWSYWEQKIHVVKEQIGDLLIF